MSMLMTEEQCIEFQRNPSRNPLTNRLIKKNGPTYKNLTLQCQYLEQEKRKKQYQETRNRIENIKTKLNSKRTLQLETETYKSKLFTHKKKEKTSIKKDDKKYLGIIVFGMGCNEQLDAIEDYVKELSRYVNMPIKYLCNNSNTNILFDIAKLACFLPPGKNSEFVKTVLNAVREAQDEGYHVILLGQSYGGSVVNRVAELYHDAGIPSDKLIVGSFGSIYIPSADKTSTVNIKHYMYDNDVALKCNKLKPGEKHANLKWLYRNRGSSVNRQQKGFKEGFKEKIFGTESAWKSHGMYSEFINDVLRNKALV